MNLRPSTRVPFDEYIERVKDVVDAGDFFYLKRYGKFDAMPACWKNLKENQRREVSALIGSFYDESKADCSKEPWSLYNLKKFLNLGYVKLDDLSKFRAAYLATRGDDSVFVEPCFIDRPANDTPKVEGNTTLLDEYDGFALKPKKLIKEFKDNPGDPKVQGKLFRHYTNYAATAHCVANRKVSIEKKSGRHTDLVPTAGLNVEVSDLQLSLLNPTFQDVIVSNIIDQVKG